MDVTADVRMDGRMDGRADAICWAGIFWRGIFKSSPMGVPRGVTSALPNRAAPSAPPGLFRPCHPVSPRIYRSYSVRTVNIPRGGERDGATRAGRHAGDMSISSHQFSPYFCPHSCGQKYGQSLFCGVPLFSGGVFSGGVFSGGLFFFFQHSLWTARGGI